jgi:succinate-semialdehyde dehydrogenase/glutarate-semialdehyde dehydrogenase
MKKLISTNPAKNFSKIGDVPISSEREIKEKVRLANNAKLKWKEMGVSKRIEMLRSVYYDFVKRKNEIAELITNEIGKTVKESKAEMNEYLEEFKWFLNHGKNALEDEITYKDASSVHKIIYEPHGTAAVITPWNFPFGMFVWGVIPNLIVGNTVVFKISEECPVTGKLIEEIMLSHKLSPGVFSEVYGAGDVGNMLVQSDVNLIWFTGSTKVGRQLYKIAAEKFIKVILEMGGSNPGIVFEDVDIDKVVKKIYSKKFENCGQTCDAIKRLIVHESIFDKVVKKLKAEIENKIVGYPEDPETDISSLSAKRQLDLLESQVKDAVEKGAKIITGGKPPKGLKGAFYLPTLLTNITPEMRVWREEVFGPVLPMAPFKNENEAVKLANDTRYGLGGTVFSKDKKRARRVASKIEAGNVEINGASHWLTCNPFGGYKLSGMGREHGIQGFHELCQIKVISEGSF